MRPTFGAWRSMSTAPMYTVHGSPTRAQAAALATPCCPAPVSAIDTACTQPPSQQRLPERIVDLVRAGVRQILALEPQLRAPARRKPRHRRQRRGAARPLAQLSLQLALKVSIAEPAACTGLESLVRRDQCLGHIAPTERPVATALIGKAARRAAPSSACERSALCLASASCTLPQQPHGPLCTKSRDQLRTLRPGADSTPLDTSTPKGRTVCTAAATLRGVQTARKNQLALSCQARGFVPIGRTPLPLRALSNSSRRAGSRARQRTRSTGSVRSACGQSQPLGDRASPLAVHRARSAQDLIDPRLRGMQRHCNHIAAPASCAGQGCSLRRMHDGAPRAQIQSQWHRHAPRVPPRLPPPSVTPQILTHSAL